jgi:predicted RecB family nuclease
MLVETKAILFNIFRDYLCTEEQKKKIIEMQKEERIENEIKKGQKFSNDVFARKDKIVENNVNTELVEIKKESISIKIWNFIKQILRKIKRK